MPARPSTALLRTLGIAVTCLCLGAPAWSAEIEGVAFLDEFRSGRHGRGGRGLHGTHGHGADSRGREHGDD